MDDLKNAVTDQVGLKGFAEIAYGVYVTSAETDRNAPTYSIDSGLSDPVLYRLRDAESALRVAGHLGSLDRERGNLWVFFDRDSPSRQANVSDADQTLRAAGCRPAVPVGSSIKSDDLLQESNGQLKRLFLSAVLAWSDHALVNSSGYVRLGPQTYGVLSTRCGTRIDNNQTPPRATPACVITIGVQLYHGSPIMLSVHTYICSDIVPLSESLAKNSIRDDLRDLDVIIAPVGRIGKLKNVCMGKGTEVEVLDTATVSKGQQCHFESEKDEIWKRSLMTWLSLQTVPYSAGNDVPWVVVELPLSSMLASETDATDYSVRGNRIPEQPQLLIWPSALTFVRTGDLQDDCESAFGDIQWRSDDPLTFIDDWCKGASARVDALGKKKAARIAEQLKQDQLNKDEAFREDDATDIGSTFQRAYQDVSSVSGIYPTPPDGALSQTTPGPPLDTASDTPKERELLTVNDMGNAISSHEGHVDFFENNDNSTGGIGTNLYHDDLFDDGAGTAFASDGIADEPNWDFFDEEEQNLGLDNVKAASAMDSGDHALLKAGSTSKSPQDVDMTVEDAADSHSKSRGKVSGGHKNEFQADDENVEDANGTSEDSSDIQDTHMEGNFDALVKPSPVVSASRPSPDENAPRLKENHETETKEDVRSKILRGPGSQDSKYGANGRFWFHFKSQPSHDEISTGRIDIRADPALPVLNTPGAIPAFRESLEESASPVSVCSSDLDTRSGDEVGEKLEVSGEGGSLASSQDAPIDTKVNVGLDSSERTHLHDSNINLLERLLAKYDVQAVLKVFGNLRRDSSVPLINSKEDIVQVAQVFVDQVSQSSLGGALFRYTSSVCSDHSQTLNALLRRFTEACSDVAFHELLGASEPQVMTLPWCHVQLKRDDKVLSALPSILPFWDTFALQPVSTSKDVMGYCVYPDGVLSLDSCESFLDRIGDAYNTCSLGSHVRGNAQGVSTRGLVPWLASFSSPFDILSQTCRSLGDSLPSLEITGANFVIYVINPYPQHNRGAQASICAAFLQLFSSYRSSRPSLKQPLDVVLQIIPASFVSANDSLVIPPQAAYSRLALEVYNRCPPSKTQDCFAECSSATRIALPPLQLPSFFLSANSRSPCTAEEKSLHVAYSLSPDKRWMTAAWSDIEGSMALTLSYCLRHTGSELSRPLVEILKEIWETSLDIISASERNRRFSWRLYVVADRCIEAEEIKAWSGLVDNQSSSPGPGQLATTLTIISMGTRSLLRIRARSASTSSATLTTSGAAQPTPTSNQANYGTPAATPKTGHSVMSPEQLMLSAPTPTASGTTAGNAPTPPAPEHSFEIDPDALLTDPADDFKYIIVPASRTLNNTCSVYEYRPALLSSYLVHPINPPPTTAGQLFATAIDINLVYRTKPNVSSTTKSDEVILIDILKQFRALITLARTRGMQSDSESLQLPWHLETAKRGREALAEAL
ncbi:MAG: hypothetical protein Q9227_002807 [Pyrenula ochraceoflavens]